MKTNKIKNFTLALTGLLIISCGSTNEKKVKENSNNDWAAGGKTEKASTGTNAIVIKKANGEVIGSINESAFSFSYGTTSYTSKLNGDKRKYNGGSDVIEVKYKEEGFKVRTSDGKLLWKVKITTDKIKISDNEEGKDPWEIKLNENDKAKIKKNDNEIGKVKMDSSKKEIEASSGSKSFVISAGKLSLAYCVLLVDEISDRDKFIIMTEIIAKGK
jgi:hypothetical protein